MAMSLALPHLFEPDVSSTDELLACISAAEGGDYMRVPVGQDDLSRALASLLRTLQRDTTRNLGHVVDASIGANEVGIMSANLLHQLYCLDEDSQTIAATSEGMAAKTAEIGEYAEEIDSSAKAASAAVTRNERILEQANAQMRIVLQTVTDANEKIAGLHALTDRVMELTQSVRKIASQTRLLAINAAVEAARAGEAGRGFSVVATEVKALADHSSSATAEIGQIVSAFSEAMRSMMVVMSTTKTAAGTGSDVMGELTGSLQEVGTNIASVSASTSSIATALRQQSEVSAEIAGQIFRTALSTNETTNSIEAIVDRIDMTQAAITSQVNVYATMNFPKKVIKLAQSDHVIWKKRLANMIIGRERLNANELADHRSCRLGKWYESVSEPALVGAKAFADLNAPHVLVHKHGIEATRLFAAGDTPAALREIGKVEDASRLVLSLLKTLEQT